MMVFKGIYLTAQELLGITGYKRNNCQERWLFENGIMYLKRRDGSLLVSRRHFEVMMGGLEGSDADRYFEPDYSSLQ